MPSLKINVAMIKEGTGTPILEAAIKSDNAAIKSIVEAYEVAFNFEQMSNSLHTLFFKALLISSKNRLPLEEPGLLDEE